jgi:hypothetical protein
VVDETISNENDRASLLWLIGCAALVAIGIGAFVAGRWNSAGPMATVTTIEVTPRRSDSLHIEYSAELSGPHMKLGLAKAIGGHVSVCTEASQGGVSHGHVHASCKINYGPYVEIVTTPTEVRLKPGERFVVARGKDKQGTAAEVYLFCERSP